MNLRPQRPERCALAKLRHAPTESRGASGDLRDPQYSGAGARGPYSALVPPATQPRIEPFEKRYKRVGHLCGRVTVDAPRRGEPCAGCRVAGRRAGRNQQKCCHRGTCDSD